MNERIGIYIAGPMRQIPEWNFPAFHRVHDEWVEWDPRAQEKIFWFCPACEDEKTGFSTVGMSGTEDLTDLGFDLRRALGKDLKWIAKNADVVVVLPGWENSKGAQAEVALAHALDLIVTAYDEYADGFGPVGIVPPHIQERMHGHPRRIIPGEPAKPSDVPRYDHLGEIPVEDLWADGNDYGYGKPLDPEVHEAAPEAVTIPTFADPYATIELPRPIGLTSMPPDYLENLSDGEVRVTSSTGGEKGKKPARFDLIPQGPLWALAELYGRGAEKYEDRNWERGYAWSLSFAALNRHLWLFWGGEDYDAETGCLHLASVAWHAFALIQFYERNNDFDDRPIR